MILISAAQRKIQTLLRLSHDERGLAIVAIALTCAIKIMLWSIPFRIAKRSAETASLPRVFRRNYSETQIVWAVRLASRYIPRASCLPQALAAQILLSGAGLESRLHIGVAQAGRFEAHAWVECSGRVLIGGSDESARYVPILTLQRELRGFSRKSD